MKMLLTGILLSCAASVSLAQQTALSMSNPGTMGGATPVRHVDLLVPAAEALKAAGYRRTPRVGVVSENLSPVFRPDDFRFQPKPQAPEWQRRVPVRR